MFVTAVNVLELLECHIEGLKVAAGSLYDGLIICLRHYIHQTRANY